MLLDGGAFGVVCLAFSEVFDGVDVFFFGDLADDVFAGEFFGDVAGADGSFGVEDGVDVLFVFFVGAGVIGEGGLDVFVAELDLTEFGV